MPPGDDLGVQILPGGTQRTWEGWGTSLCWWAGVFGDRSDLADLFFTLNYTAIPEVQRGVELPGLGFNIVRYNAGASSSTSVMGETMVLSPNIPPFKIMSVFWTGGCNDTANVTCWDWTADATQVQARASWLGLCFPRWKQAHCLFPVLVQPTGQHASQRSQPRR